MAPQADCVAEIYASQPGGAESFGTGYLIAPGLVLTALHVVAPALVDGGTCEVRLVGDFLANRCEWQAFVPCWYERELDLALLRVGADDRPARDGPQAITRFATLVRDDHPEDCNAIGFPRILRHEGQNDTQQVHGTVYKQSLLKRDLWQVLVKSGRPRDANGWKGVSGSAVFSADHLIGVIVQTDTWFDDGVLIVQPLEHAFRCADWHRHLPEGSPQDLEPIPRLRTSNPWPDLYGLAYLVDRQAQSADLQGAVEIAVKAPAGSRVLVCGAPGRPEDCHGDLMDLFRNETMPGLFPGRFGFDQIVPMDWPAKEDSVARGLASLRRQLRRALGIANADPAHSAENIRAAFNAGSKPRVWYWDIRASAFTALQRDILLAWLDEWSRISAAGLNDFVVLFFNLILDRTPAPPPKWRFWAGRVDAELSLLEFAIQQFRPSADEELLHDAAHLRLLLLPELGKLQRKPHLPDWQKKLENDRVHRGLARFVRSVEMKMPEHPFPLSTLISTLDNMKHEPTET
ncbi:MAG: serine protease [Burkholderiaceae bacterium]